MTQPQPDPYADLHAHIEALWEARHAITPRTGGDDRAAIETALEKLDSGELRVAQRVDGGWLVHAWLKQAVLLSFRLHPNTLVRGVGGAPNWDKVALKFAHWGAQRFGDSGIRAVPGAIVRHSAYVAPDVVLMPCFVNVGAYIDRGTMVDAWATVGSCAQIGRNCHISGGAGIGGVLEPLQSGPVIIEDEVFIGARSEVAEGAIVERGAVLAMGVFIGGSTKVVDRDTGEITVGRVPEYSVVVPGTLPGRALPDGSAGPSLGCAVIVKRVDAQTRAKTAINELLRN